MDLETRPKIVFVDQRNVRINKFFETDFTKTVNVKKQRRFDRSTVIFKLKSKKFLYEEYDLNITKTELIELLEIATKNQLFNSKEICMSKWMGLP